MSAQNPIRSPSYPSTPLGQAIAQVRKIESVYRTAQVDRGEAAKLIGYSGLSGPANKALAALAQFGLVERAGKGEMRVTLRAKAILHPDSDEERRQHIRAAALEPKLFQELQDRWPGIIPPEDGVVTYLNRQGFNNSAIRPAAQAYLQTLLFLEEQGAIESHGSSDESRPIEGALNAKLDDLTMSATATLSPALPTPPVSVYQTPPPELNRIDMNIMGGKVQISALLDLNGVLDLEKKLAALKMILDAPATDTDVVAVEELGRDRSI